MNNKEIYFFNDENIDPATFFIYETVAAERGQDGFVYFEESELLYKGDQSLGSLLFGWGFALARAEEKVIVVMLNPDDILKLPKGYNFI